VSQTFRFNGTDLGTEAVRLGKIEGFVTKAELGAVGISQVVVDNPAGTVSITGLLPFTVDESAETAGDQRTYTGRTMERTYRRRAGSSLITGAANEIVSPSRPERRAGRPDHHRGSARETVTARKNWLLSTYLSGDVFDNGFVGSSSTTMDAVDYTGQKPPTCSPISASSRLELLCLLRRGGRPVVAVVAELEHLGRLGFGMFITNELAGVDQAAILAGTATVFYGSLGDNLVRDPGRVYVGVYLPYAKGYVYVTDPTIESNFAWRDGSAPNSNVKTSAIATSIANAFLADNATEDDRITCTVQPSAIQANAIKAGQLVQCKFTHLPGYETYTYMRVLSRSLAQTDETDQHYRLTLELPLAPATPLATRARSVGGQRHRLDQLGVVGTPRRCPGAGEPYDPLYGNRLPRTGPNRDHDLGDGTDGAQGDVIGMRAGFTITGRSARTGSWSSEANSTGGLG
jgi:hypothetical protein